MGKDLKLDRQRHDLSVDKLDLSLVDKIDKVAQQLKIRLLFVFGEWFLNINAGIPYFSEVYLKNPTLPQIEATLKETILTTPDVFDLLSFSMELDTPRRRLSVRFAVNTIHGRLQLDEGINI